DDRVHLKPITVTQLFDNAIEVGEGISEDDRIVNNPTAALLEGSKVRVVTPAPGYDLVNSMDGGSGMSQPTQGSQSPQTPQPSQASESAPSAPPPQPAGQQPQKDLQPGPLRQPPAARQQVRP